MKREASRQRFSISPHASNPYAMYCRQATKRELCPRFQSSSHFLRIQFSSMHKKKTKIKNKSESRIHPLAPIFVVLKLLRSTSKVHPGTAEHIRFINSERPRSRGESRRSHWFRWLWRRLHFRLPAPLLPHVILYGGTSKVLWRRRRPRGAAVGCVVRVVVVYRGETTVCD